MWGNLEPHNSTYTSPSLVHVCNNRPADSTCIASYVGRQHARTVLNVDIVGSSKCHTRHLATGGVAHLNYILATNSNPVMTCASAGQVNPYPNTVLHSTVPRTNVLLASSKVKGTVLLHLYAPPLQITWVF